MQRICPGRCNRRYRDAHDDYSRAVDTWHTANLAYAANIASGGDPGPEPERPEEPTVRPVWGEPVWCLTDAASVRAGLTDVDELMTLHLHHNDGYGSPGMDERVSGSAEPSSMSPAHDDLDELMEWLRDWEGAYRESQGWPTVPYRGESAPALTATVAWLTRHLDVILAHPDLAEGFGLGVLRWHARLQGATKARPRRRSLPLRCPQCHLATLSQEEGSDRIECRNRDCGGNRGGPVLLTEAEYAGLVADAKPTKAAAAVALAARRASRPLVEYGELSGRA